MPPQNTVIVIGAGMAGLSAARQLAEAGLSVTVLEASNRVGGRIHTVREGTEVIELGAEFIHGRPPELWQLIEEAGLESYEIDGSTVSFEDGRLTERDEQEEPINLLEGLESWTGSDITFAEYLARNPLPEDQRQSAIGYVEGFNAADHRIIGVASLAAQQDAEDEIEGDRLFRLSNGYDRLPIFLAGKIEAAGGHIALDTLIERIDWSSKHVRISANRSGSQRILKRRGPSLPCPSAFSSRTRSRSILHQIPCTKRSAFAWVLCADSLWSFANASGRDSRRRHSAG